MTKSPLSFLVALLVGGPFAAADAWAWANHSDFANQVKSVANNGCETSPNLTDQAGWADTAAHNDGIGDVYVDEEFNHHSCFGFGDMAHAYMPTGNVNCFGDKGNAPENADGFWEKAKLFRDNGALTSSRRTLGRGQHYIQDVGNPWHTTADPFYNSCHGAVESWIAQNFNSLPYNFAADVRAGALFQAGEQTCGTYSSAKDTLTRNMAVTSDDIADANGLDCDTYAPGLLGPFQEGAWHSIMWWTGYYNWKYYRPLCKRC